MQHFTGTSETFGDYKRLYFYFSHQGDFQRKRLVHYQVYNTTIHSFLKNFVLNYSRKSFWNYPIDSSRRKKNFQGQRTLQESIYEFLYQFSKNLPEINSKLFSLILQSNYPAVCLVQEIFQRFLKKFVREHSQGFFFSNKNLHEFFHLFMCIITQK